MKILLVNKFHYHKGGAETYYFALAEGLRNEGHEVIYFSMQDEKNEPCNQSKYFVSGVDYNKKHSLLENIKISLKLIYSFEAKKKFEQLIMDEKPDIIHLNNIHRQITLSIVSVARKYSIPTVFTLHDLICVCPNCVMLSREGICELCLHGDYKNCIRNSCIKNSRIKSALAVIEAYFYRIIKQYDKVDLYITPSNFLKNKLIEGNFLKKNIVQLTNFLPQKTQFKLIENIENYFLYFGRVSSEKGILTLIKAFEKMPPHIKLKIAGDGPQINEITEYINKHSLQHKIFLMGFQNRENMDALIEKSICVVVPSEWYENGPYAVMETFAKGIPVISTRHGGLAEMIVDGLNGFTFNAGNIEELFLQMNKILSMEKIQYSNLRLAALEFAKKNYTSERYLSEVITIYKELLKSMKRNFILVE